MGRGGVWNPQPTLLGYTTGATASMPSNACILIQ